MKRLALLLVLLCSDAHAGQVIKPKPISTFKQPMIAGKPGTLRCEVWQSCWEVHPEWYGDSDCDFTTFNGYEIHYWKWNEHCQPEIKYLRPDDTECTETEYEWGMLIWRGE